MKATKVKHSAAVKSAANQVAEVKNEAAPALALKQDAPNDLVYPKVKFIKPATPKKSNSESK